ncbi:MAG: ABC transporter permease [Gemmataceae bacterium]|nr:ABC transporter permease [Gemmataceae bacterium]
MSTCVFRQEMLLAGRRQRTHALRWMYAGFVIVQLVPVLLLADSFSAWMAGGGFSGFFERLVIFHFGLIALLTPALAGGAITEEKTSGTLQYLLTAHLSAWEIVFGKLLARTYQLVLMSLAGLPLVCWFSGFGGVGALPLALLILSLAMILGLGAAAILASVWSRQTRQAVLAIYLLGLAVVAARALLTSPRLIGLVDALNPLRALTLDNGTLDWRRVGQCALGWTVLGFVCLVIAALRLRGAYLRQLRQVARTAWRWRPMRRPRLGNNPVAWREQHVVGIVPGLGRWPRWLGCLAVAVLVTCSYSWFLQRALPANVNLVDHVRHGRLAELRAAALRAGPGITAVFFWHGCALLAVTSLVVALRASGSITSEREQATWASLLQTPLTTRSVIRGKYWGTIGACAPYLVTAGIVALVCSILIGAVGARFAASSGAIVWTLLWLSAAALTVPFVAAVGIWCSVRSRNSWSSLVSTLGLCYLTWIALCIPVALVVVFLQGVLEILVGFIAWMIDNESLSLSWGALDLQWIAVGGSFLVAYWILTQRLLIAAEKRVAKVDRNKDVDPQYDWFHQRWLEKIGLTAHVLKPPDPELLKQPLPLYEEAAETGEAVSR